MQQTAERRTRFERERPPGLAITDRDIAILEATARHRFVRSTHVQALMPDEPAVKILRRLHKLYHNGYVDGAVSNDVGIAGGAVSRGLRLTG